MSLHRCPSCADAPILNVQSEQPYQSQCLRCKGGLFSFQVMSKRCGAYVVQRMIALIEFKLFEPGHPCPRCPKRMLNIHPFDSYPRKEQYGALSQGLDHWKSEQKKIPIQVCPECLLFWVDLNTQQKLPEATHPPLSPELSIESQKLDELSLSAIAQIPEVELESISYRKYPITLILTLICFISFLIFRNTPPTSLMFTPSRNFEDLGFSTITSLFLHANTSHLFGNLLFLFVFLKFSSSRKPSSTSGILCPKFSI